MKSKIIFATLFFTCVIYCAKAQHQKKEVSAYQIGAYYFADYHLDKRNEEYRGKGWTEWKLVKEAKPRFAGHHQPNVPLWGYTDEADPKQMAQKIEAASSQG